MKAEAIKILDEFCQQGNSKAYAARLCVIKQWAAACREDAAVYGLMVWALDAAKARISEIGLAIFREFYLDSPATARKISERHYLDPCTIYRRLNVVFQALMPVLFGVDGINWGEGEPP